MSSKPILRSARRGDLPALVAIYNHYVRETHVTFDLEPYDEAGRVGWFEGFADTGPYRLLVAEDDGVVAGYASSGRFRPKPGYDSSVETTIYLHPDTQGRGLGMRLYVHLLETVARETTVHRAFAGIALPNAASVRLHERCGFSHLGTFHQVGRKHGRFWDVAWFESRLGQSLDRHS